MRISPLRKRGMRHTATMRVLTSNSAAAQAQWVGCGPLETPIEAYRPWTPKESALWCRLMLFGKALT